MIPPYSIIGAVNQGWSIRFITYIYICICIETYRKHMKTHMFVHTYQLCLYVVQKSRSDMLKKTTHHQLAGFVGHEVKIQKTDLLSWSKCSRFRRLIIFGYIWTSLSKYWLDITSVGSFKQSRTYEINSALLMIESCKNIVKSC